MRDVWENEATDFTPWLAKAENLMELGEVIGIRIESPETEASVGNFRADILAKEEDTDRTIIIENQLEKTNHSHLGKILTYASWHGAKTIIWIVEYARDEHKKAIEWLNEHTDKDTFFWLVGIKLYRIGESAIAPKFEIISSSSDWQNKVKDQPLEELSDTKSNYLFFFEGLRDYIISKDKNIKLQTPGAKAWYWITLGMGMTGIGYSIVLNATKNSISFQLYIADNKSLHSFLMIDKGVTQKIPGQKIPGLYDKETKAKTARKFRIDREVADIFDKTKNEENFKWILEQYQLFDKIFKPLLKEYKDAQGNKPIRK